MAVVGYDRPLVELEVPEPELGPGTAIVEVLACGVCFSDVKTSRGQMPFSAGLSLPHVPGHEICGRVIGTHPPDLFEEGQLVIVHNYQPCGRCRRCRDGDECLCRELRGWVGFTDPGGFQERLAVPVNRLLPLPAGTDPVTAAPMTCALGTAYRATVTKGRARPGSTLAVIGLGGVGIHAIQIAAAAGSAVLGLDVSEGAVAAARELGLRAVDSRAFDRSASDLDGVVDEGFDTVVVTAASGAAYAQAAELVRPGGRLVCVGYALDSTFALATPRLVLDEIRVLGSRFVTYAELARVVELVRRGALTPVVDTVRPLEEVNEAFDDLANGRVVGRTVLRVARED